MIDGSRLEGGGQILRNAVSYGAVLGRAVEVRNVRANRRPKPGLRPQHLTGMRLAADICGGHLRGDAIGSTEVGYEPPSSREKASEISKGVKDGEGDRTFVGDTGTAGSICLLLQTALPCALFAAVRSFPPSAVDLELRGGTNASMAPQVDYLTDVFLPAATEGFGLPPIDIHVERRGYFPRGGGIVRARIPPMTEKMRPIRLVERGRVADIRIRAFHAGKVPRWVAQKMADAAVKTLRIEAWGDADAALPSDFRPKVEVVEDKSAVGSGSGLILVARTGTGCLLAGSALGRPKVRAEKTGEEAARELASALKAGGCVDEWLQDQLVLFMALAGGESEVLTGCLTLHTQTAIGVAEELTGVSFEVERLEGDLKERSGGDAKYGEAGRISGKHRIRCKGIGFVHP